MTLTLSAPAAARLENTLKVLLSPLDHPTTGAWCDAASDALAQLFTADRSVFFLPVGDRQHFITRRFDPEFAEPFRLSLAGTEEGRNRYSYPMLDRMMSRLATARLEAWTMPLLERVSRIRKEEVPFYHEVLVPGGMAHLSMLAAPLSSGQAMLGVFHAQESRNPFGNEALTVLRLVLPAFQAGVGMLASLDARRAELGSALERLVQGLIIFDEKGAETYRNQAMKRILAGEPKPEVLLARVGRLAADVRRLCFPKRDRGAAPNMLRSTILKTKTGHYSATTSLLAPGTFGPGSAIVVALNAPTPPRLPTTAVLQQSFGLSSRESGIALLLARGWSNRRIAAELSISEHTVRHHAQHVLEKLGLHSRKALALELMKSWEGSI